MVKFSGAMHDKTGSRPASSAKLPKVRSVSSLDPPRTLLRQDPHWVMTFFIGSYNRLQIDGCHYVRQEVAFIFSTIKGCKAQQSVVTFMRHFSNSKRPLHVFLSLLHCIKLSLWIGAYRNSLLAYLVSTLLLFFL